MIVQGPWGRAIPAKRYGSVGLEPVGDGCPDARGEWRTSCMSGSGSSGCLGCCGERVINGQLHVLCRWEPLTGEVKNHG